MTSLATRPEHELSLFRTALDEWFDRFMGRWPALFEDGWLNGYGVETEETDEALIVRIDAPGFEPDEFNVEVRETELRVTAEHKEPVEEGKEPEIERRLHRTMTLPVAVEPEKVEAKYHSGVLELRLGKAEPVKTRRIEVKAA